MPVYRQTDQDILSIYDRQADTVYRVCYAYMKNAPEAEDMTQETFLRLITKGVVFESQRHERAWLIVTASNLCKDALKKWWRRVENIEDHAQTAEAPREAESGVWDAILSLPDDYKTAVYMFYYEGYTTAEIARHVHCPEGTVRSRLSRAKKLLMNRLGGAE